ncbi:MAG: hypothetical protein ACYTHJ_20990 [Planctomycetota bacterium]
MRLLSCAILVSLVAISTGCATNSFAGHSLRERGKYYGAIEIAGNNTELYILTGSHVPKLAITGDLCVVTVEDDVVLGRIDIWGNGNNVSIPFDLRVSISQVGSNQITRRDQGEVLKTGESEGDSAKPGGD